MKTEVKAKWVAALRSGEYEQGSYVLRDVKDKFCCLGVLCDLYTREQPGLHWHPLHSECHYVIGDRTGALPALVVEWAGLDYEMPEVIMGGTKEISLARLNDFVRLPFTDIAKLIEEQL